MSYIMVVSHVSHRCRCTPDKVIFKCLYVVRVFFSKHRWVRKWKLVCIADRTRCTKMNSYVIIIIIYTNDKNGEWRMCGVLRASMRGNVLWSLACVHTWRIRLYYYIIFWCEPICFFNFFDLPVQVWNQQRNG